eukprot:13575733-Alexandrium_andersonii.AAC.1
MSASLVGSEMCIRDRLDTGRKCNVATSKISAGHQCGLPSAPPEGPQGECCLLYTSDAADDM